MNTDDTSNMTFAQRLRYLRESQRYTRVAFAKETGIPDKTLQRYEYGCSEPGAARVKILADTLGVPANYLLSGEPLSSLKG